MDYTTKIIIRALCALRREMCLLRKEVDQLKSHQQDDITLPRQLNTAWEKEIDPEFNFRISDR